MAAIRNFTAIPIKMPREAILKRMGYNRHLTKLTPQQESRIESLMENGFSLCNLSGRLLELPVISIDEQTVKAEGITFHSRYLAQTLKGCTTLLLLAATAGKAITEESQNFMAKEDGVAGMVYDAVGSETVDNALNWMQEMLKRELPRRGLTLCKMRFSPGYGDLALNEQRKIFDCLKLAELGIAMTESCIMLPEKSVAGISGLIPAK